MPKPLGGRGKKAPYQTVIMRVPLNLKSEIEQMVNQFHDELHNLPVDNSVEDWEVGFLDGQILAAGGSRDLVRLVAEGNHDRISKELAKVTDQEQRDRLVLIVDRLLRMIASKR